MKPMQCWLAGAVAAFLLCGCGGGSGGGGRLGQLTLSQTSLTLEGALADDAPPVAQVTGTVTGIDEPVYIFVQHTNVGIDTVSFSQSGERNGELTIRGRQPDSLGEGSYDDSISVSVCLDQNCQRQVGGSPARIDVRYTVSDTLVLDSPSLRFGAVSGSSMVPQPEQSTVTVRTANRRWRLRSEQDWIVLSVTSGVGAQAVGVSVAPANLAAGRYTGALIVEDVDTGESDTSTVILDVQAPSLTVSGPSLIDVRGDAIEDFDVQAFEIRLDTGTREHPWQATLDGQALPAWLILEPTSGTLAAPGQALQLRIDPTGLNQSEVGGALAFSATVNGATVTSSSVNLRVRLEPHRLRARTRSLAFTQLDGVSHLSAQVPILTNRGLPANWTARIECPAGDPQGWLFATPAGEANTTLALAADPASLADGTLALCEVVLESSTASITNSGEERIRVGLFVDRGLQVEDRRTVGISAAAIAVDPARPYVYASVGTSVEVYHQYTAERVAAIAIGGAAGRMAVSDDGRWLYAVDESGYRIAVIDLDQSVLVRHFSQPGWDACSECDAQFRMTDIDVTTVRGRRLLVMAKGQVLDALTGDLLYGSPSVNAFAGQFVADLSGDGRTLYVGDNRGAPATVRRSRLDFSELDQEVDLQQTHTGGVVAYARGFAVDDSGSRLYRACWYANKSIDEYDGRDLARISQIPSGSNGGALLTAGNSLLCARYYPSSSSPSVWEVDLDDRSIIAEYTMPEEIEQRQFALSSDGHVLVTLGEIGQVKQLGFTRADGAYP